jgi:hypothetical protein
MLFRLLPYDNPRKEDYRRLAEAAKKGNLISNEPYVEALKEVIKKNYILEMYLYSKIQGHPLVDLGCGSRSSRDIVDRMFSRLTLPIDLIQVDHFSIKHSMI